MKLTDYKYRKARKIIKSAKVKGGVKELMFCALRGYKNGLKPAQQLFVEGQKACLIGAAITNRLHGDIEEFGFDWEQQAHKEFKLSWKDTNNIINGFDTDRSDKPINKTARLAQNLATFFGLNKED